MSSSLLPLVLEKIFDNSNFTDGEGSSENSVIFAALTNFIFHTFSRFQDLNNFSSTPDSVALLISTMMYIFTRCIHCFIVCRGRLNTASKKKCLLQFFLLAFCKMHLCRWLWSTDTLDLKSSKQSVCLYHVDGVAHSLHLFWGHKEIFPIFSNKLQYILLENIFNGLDYVFTWYS